MKAKWLVELDLFLDTEVRLLESLKKHNIEHKVLKYIPFDDDFVLRCRNKFNEKDCVVFYGSLNFARKLRGNVPWIPGVYGDYKMYECLSYYPAFGDNFLNNDYIMMPFGDLNRRKEFIYEHYNTTRFFCRPNSGLKEFTGTIVPDWDFDTLMRTMSFYNVPNSELIVVSSPKTIIREWRFIVINKDICEDYENEIITGSLYRDYTRSKDEVLHELCTDNEVLDYAIQMSKLYKPENAWTLDICQLDTGELKVLEIGCFSSAGWYGCDINIIVDRISELAEYEYNLYHENNIDD